MIVLTRTDGSAVGINSRRVLYVDHPFHDKGEKGSLITMNNGDKIEVQDAPHKVIARVDKDRRKG